MKRKTSSEVKKQQQQPTSQKPPGGSLKQVPPLGVLLRFLTSQVGYLTRENYAQKYDLTSVHAACTPMIYNSSCKQRLPWNRKSLISWTKDMGNCTRGLKAKEISKHF